MNITEKAEREEMEAKYGQVWTKDEMQEEFDVLGFAMYLCIVKRKSDGKEGSLDFTNAKERRWYHSFR